MPAREDGEDGARTAQGALRFRPTSLRGWGGPCRDLGFDIVARMNASAVSSQDLCLCGLCFLWLAFE